MHFTIEQKLPSLNEVISENRKHAQKGAKMKREIEETIGLYIRCARYRGDIRPISTPVIVCIEWHEKTKRRDADNIQSSQKFILDALQKAGIIINDSRKFVKNIYHEIIDDDSDFVVVYFLDPAEAQRWRKDT